LISFSTNVPGYSQPEEPCRKANDPPKEKPGQIVDDIGCLTTSPYARHDELEAFNHEWKYHSSCEE